MELNLRERLIIRHPPHVTTGETVHCLMFDVVIASIPLLLAGFYFFGPRSLLIVIISSVSAILAEILVQIWHIKPLKLNEIFYQIVTHERITVSDGSALVTGILLGFNLPPTVPLWIPVVGSFVAITLGKHFFGGLGHNIFNPALFARAFLMFAWPAHMSRWVGPVTWEITQSGISYSFDALSQATPLFLAKGQEVEYNVLDLFLGKVGGCIGETSSLAILIGGAYMLYKGTITWHIPFSYIFSVGILALILGRDPIFHLFSGGLFLGAFFMATDVVTSPVTKSGRLIFGIGCGVLTMLIRVYGSYPEGVCFSILLMNALTPLIDKYTLKFSTVLKG